jgi:hypothetical protein
VRLSRCEVRDHINYRKNDRWRSHRFYRALQRLESPMRSICEIFGAPQLSSFSTQSPQQQTSMRTASGAFDLTKTEIASGSESTTPSRTTDLPDLPRRLMSASTIPAMVSSQRLKACGAIGWALAFGLARQIGLPLHSGLHTGEIKLRVRDLGGVVVHAAAPVMTNRRQRG